MLGLIAIVGIIGNCMIIVAVAFSKKLQTSTNVFVTSLAVTDLLTCWAAIIGLGFQPLILKLNEDEFCKLFEFVIYSFIGTSIYTLAVIGIHRLILITKPHLCRRIFTSWRLGIFVAILWITPGGIFLIILLINGVEFNHVYKNCRWVQTHERAEKFEQIWHIVISLIPCTAVIVSYSWIFIHIKKHFKTQKQHLINFRATGPGSSSTLSRPEVSVVNEAATTVTNPRIKEISQQQIQITKNLFLVVCAFFICFTPHSLIVLVGKPSPTVNDITVYLQLPVLASSAINFFIYASKHPDFKIVLGHMMRCSYSKIPQPSRLLKFLLSKQK